MSNTNTSKHRIPIYRRPLFIGGVVVVAIVIVTICIAVPKSHESTSTQPPSNNQSSVSQPPSKPDNSDSEPSTEPKRPSQYEGGDPNQLPELTGFISYKNVDYDAGEIMISAGIDQYLMSDGSCTLRFKQGESVAYSVSTPAIADVTTSVCETFRIPLSSLSSGDYQIEILIEGDNKTGLITDSVQI